MSKQMHFFIKYGRRVEVKVNSNGWYSKDLQQGEGEGGHEKKSSEHEKMLHRFEEYVIKMCCQRNENNDLHQK